MVDGQGCKGVPECFLYYLMKEKSVAMHCVIALSALGIL